MSRVAARCQREVDALDRPDRFPGGFKHLVVVYLENHSFDNLYGQWGDVGGQHVDGLADAPPAQTLQVAQDGTPFDCLLQNDVNLTSPPLPADCADGHQVTGSPTAGFTSHFANQPFRIDDYLTPASRTCQPEGGDFGATGVPAPLGDPGGCTRDLVHRFYQEQYQIDGGRQDRYVTGSDAVGLAMGHYDTTQLPIWQYLHSKGAPRYVVADHFFQAAFGGSFLNHQWLIAARTPYDDPNGQVPAGRARARTSRVDAQGMPVKSYPLYGTTADVLDAERTVACPADEPDPYAAACGRFAVNTVQPSSPPYAPNAGARFIPLIDDDLYPNIGDRLSAAGVSWGWYAGGWDDVTHGRPAPLFQFHHQPFVYFEGYAPGTPGRTHLRDEQEFLAAAREGTLPTVSFVKPYGAENEHPGYASESTGSDHLVQLLRAVTEGGAAGNTLVVVTYDEFGGQWDHVAPPTVDRWGPGTRTPPWSSAARSPARAWTTRATTRPRSWPPSSGRSGWRRSRTATPPPTTSARRSPWAAAADPGPDPGRGPGGGRAQPMLVLCSPRPSCRIFSTCSRSSIGPNGLMM